jgi:mutator protein MutT
VGAVIVDGAARVLLVKRRFAPLAGEWSLPGGAVDVGETLQECVVREIREETGLEVEVGAVIEVFDRIMHDVEGRVQYHYVLVDYVCRPVGGTPAAASDVADVAWADPGALAGFSLTEKATAVIGRGLTLADEAGWTERSVATPRKGL